MMIHEEQREAHPEAEIARLFTGRLATERRAAVQDHVRECASCRRLYERHAAAESALLGESEGLNAWAADRVAARLFAGQEARPEVVPLTRRALRPALALSAVLGTALVVARTAPTQDDLQARSGGRTLSAGTSVRALVLRAEEDGPDQGFAVRDLSDGPVSAGERLKLLYTNLDGWSELTLTLTAAGRTLLQRGPLPVAAGAEDRALGASVLVPSDWPKGQVEIRAVFTRGGRASAGEQAVDAPDHAVRVLRLALGEGR